MDQTVPQKKPKRLGIYLSLTPEENGRLLAEKAATGLTAQYLVKEAYFRQPLIRVLMPESESQKVLTALQRIGNNVNQIARHLNSGFREGFNATLSEIRDELKTLEQYVGGFYGHC